MVNKKGEAQNTIIVQVILIALIMAMFIYVTAAKIDGRGVHQDIIESQLAMFIDAAQPGMTFEVYRLNADGLIEDVKTKGSKIYVKIDGLDSSTGKTFFTPYNVRVEKESGKFKVIVE